MTDFMRTPLFVANWKMNKTIPEALDYAKKFLMLLEPTTSDVFIAPPFTAIEPLSSYFYHAESKVVVGAQNMSDLLDGAFTGEISASMLIDAGAKFVILGHSERRRYFKESHDFINRKAALALNSGLSAIVCTGETKDERAQGLTHDVILKQLSEGLKRIMADEASSLILAYEPIWAIGNSQAATPEDAQAVQAFVRSWVKSQWGEKLAQQIRIVYGGSVTAENAKEFLMEKDIDGLLVGGASLDPKSFSDIINLN